jgi:hypothetical protein
MIKRAFAHLAQDDRFVIVWESPRKIIGHPKRDNKTEGVLELIHSDVCAPMPSSSISRYVYYVSFIDDFSRKT